jgi:hypothetical protein
MRLHAYPYTSAGDDPSKIVLASSLNEESVRIPRPAHQSQFISPLFGPEEVSSQDGRANAPLSSEKLRNPYVSPMLQVCMRALIRRLRHSHNNLHTVLIARANEHMSWLDMTSCRCGI